jgi:excisionase family DNA binding protein
MAKSKKKDWITPAEAAKITGLATGTICKKIREGIIDGEADGRLWRVSKKSVHQAMADGKLPYPRNRKKKGSNGTALCDDADTLDRAYKAAMTSVFMDEGDSQEDAEDKATAITRRAHSIAAVL